MKVGTGHGLNHGTLTLNIFVPPSGVNLHAVFLGAVFGFLAFTGFEAAGALGEETVNPGREIPRAIGVSILAVAIFYVACIAVQSLGFGANTAGSAAFASSSGPLFQLSGSYPVQCGARPDPRSVLRSALSVPRPVKPWPRLPADVCKLSRDGAHRCRWPGSPHRRARHGARSS